MGQQGTRIGQRKVKIAIGRKTIYKTVYKNTCSECKCEFDSTRSDALTCSDKCRQARKTRKDKEREYLRGLQETEPLFGGQPDERKLIDPDGWKAFPWATQQASQNV